MLFQLSGGGVTNTSASILDQIDVTTDWKAFSTSTGSGYVSNKLDLIYFNGRKIFLVIV